MVYDVFCSGLLVISCCWLRCVCFGWLCFGMLVWILFCYLSSLGLWLLGSACLRLRLAEFVWCSWTGVVWVCGGLCW